MPRKWMCAWCGALLVRRPKESPSAFLMRRYCSISCGVSATNSRRARELRARRDAEKIEARLAWARRDRSAEMPPPLWEEGS